MYAGNTAKNIVLFIGDGMGPEQVRAASYYATGREDGLAMQTLPCHGLMTTHSADNAVTDSAASATALATGVKVNNGVIAIRRPGSNEPLATILEHFQARGSLTGVITTDSLVGATPAAFCAHQAHRGLAEPIAVDILRRSRPNVLFGGGGPGMSPESARAAGYTVTARGDELAKLLDAGEATPHLAGVFGSGRFNYIHEAPESYESTYPRLAQMTDVALTVLSRSDQGFFLMVESALIDKSGHSQLLDDDKLRTRCNISETLELDRAVQVALRFAKNHPETLIIVTADHETGDCHIQSTGDAGAWPNVHWASKSHTGIPVPIFASGPGADRCSPKTDSADVFRIMAESSGINLALPATAPPGDQAEE